MIQMKRLAVPGTVAFTSGISLSLGLSDVLSRLKSGICVFLDNSATETVPCSSQRIRVCVLAARLTAGEVCLGDPVNVTSVRFFHCKVIILSFAVNKYLMERYSKAMQISPFSLYCRLVDLTFTDANCLK